MNKYDLIVAGGGFAGASAALSAARQGLSVLLIDKSGCLGGAAVNCLVNPFMRYYTNKDGNRTMLSEGIFGEIIRLLKERNPLTSDQYFSEEDLKIILNRLLPEAGVDLLFHSYIYDTDVEDDKITAVCVANKSGRQKYEARFFIDATGDADLAVMSGCPTRLGRDEDNLCQPMTLCFRVANVDMEAFKEDKPNINPLYQKLQAEGKIKNPRENVLVFNFPPAEGVLHFNTTRIIKKNPVDAIDLTRAEIDSREQVDELMNFLKENFKSFKNSSLIMTAPEIGVRESRMIIGEHVLTSEELLACTKFDDSISACCYDIDIHSPDGSGTYIHQLEPGTYYTIPYRSLVPKNITNLLVAGRCISSDHEAQASYRIMPTCSTLGEAAGIGAVVALKNNTSAKDADIKQIQKLLTDAGAFIG